MLKNLPAMQETWIQSLVWEDPLEKEMTTCPSILTWRIPWTEVWWNTGRGVAKSQIPTNTFIFFCDTGELSFNLVTLGVIEADK